MNTTNYIVYRQEDEPKNKNGIWIHHKVYKDLSSPIIVQVYSQGKWQDIKDGKPSSGTIEGVGIKSIQSITKDEFDALEEKDPETIYIVKNDPTYDIYFGESKVVDNSTEDSNMTNILWADLVSLRDSSKLVPSKFYRITDYVATTVQSSTQSANHPFDVIVLALAANKLSEEAWAIMHDNIYDVTFGDEEIRRCYFYPVNGDTSNINIVDCHTLLGVSEVGMAECQIDDINKKIILEEYTSDCLDTTDLQYNYFQNCNLEAWKIKYCLDNDTARFAWADAVNGKGVVYRMIDEFNNDVPYDFKNIQYQFRSSFKIHTYYGPTNYGLYNPTDETKTISSITYYKWNRASYAGIWTPPTEIWTTVSPDNISTDMSLYTISGDVATQVSYTIFGLTTDNYDTFTFEVNGIDSSLLAAQKCYGNKIKPYIVDGVAQLNKIIFRAVSDISILQCYSNTFGNNCNYNIISNDCYNNTFGNSCSNNTFDQSCRNNTFGNLCSANIFGNSCYNSILGNECSNNTFGISCQNNTFGNNCKNNIFGNDCLSNTFGNSCLDNTFGNSCYSNILGNGCGINILGNFCEKNTFGNYCRNNTFENNCFDNHFGDYCSSNTFGNDCSKIYFGSDSNTLKSYCRYIIVESGNTYIYLNPTGTTSAVAYYQNVKIAQGVNSSNTLKTITDSNVGQTIQTIYKPTGSVETEV